MYLHISKASRWIGVAKSATTEAMRRFAAARHGGVAVFFGLTAPVLICAVAISINYGASARLKIRLDNAADAAALAQGTPAANNYFAGYTGTGDPTAQAQPRWPRPRRRTCSKPTPARCPRAR